MCKAIKSIVNIIFMCLVIQNNFLFGMQGDTVCERVGYLFNYALRRFGVIKRLESIQPVQCLVDETQGFVTDDRFMEQTIPETNRNSAVRRAGYANLNHLEEFKRILENTAITAINDIFFDLETQYNTAINCINELVEKVEDVTTCDNCQHMKVLVQHLTQQFIFLLRAQAALDGQIMFRDSVDSPINTEFLAIAAVDDNDIYELVAKKKEEILKIFSSLFEGMRKELATISSDSRMKTLYRVNFLIQVFIDQYTHLKKFDYSNIVYVETAFRLLEKKNNLTQDDLEGMYSSGKILQKINAGNAVIFSNCFVCLDIPDSNTWIILPCRHVGCFTCLENWLLKNPCCPICRRDISILQNIII